MRPQTYFRIALFSPFLLWLLCLLMVLPFSISNIEMPDVLNIILMPAMFYTIGIILWLIPYSILALGLWIWSKNRSITALRNAAWLSPVLLSVLMVVEAGLAYLFTDSFAEFARSIFEISAMMGGLSLIFGYVCVGFSLGVFKLLQIKNRIVQDAPPPTSEP